MNREYHQCYSPSLQQDMELLVFGDGGTPVLLFPARMGRFYDDENWRVIEVIRGKIEQGQLQVFCLDSVDTESFYCASSHPSEKIARYLQYEQYILSEVIPFVQDKNPGAAMISAGCSLGAFYAVNIALKYPGFFYKVVGMTGRYDLSQPIGHYGDLMQGYWDETVYYNMPNQYLPNISDPGLLQSLRKLEIILAVRQDDPCLGSISYLSQVLHDKEIPASFYVWQEEAHKPCYWRKMVELYL